MRVVVTGATGFLGRHALAALAPHYPDLRGLGSRDYDLMDPAAVRRMFQQERPDVVVHLAAYSGGIGANRKYPADFFYRNTLLTSLMFQAASEHGLKKLVYPMGGCSYPATARSPIDESQMWDGYSQVESAGYSMAKKMGIVASRSYREQYGLNSVVIIPGNMYGPYDNFQAEASHVVPAMIRRFHEAMVTGAPEVAMWGTGNPQRDFVYVADVAATIPYFIEDYDSSEPVNLSSGTTTSIKELAEAIGQLVGYTGRIAWDTTKPDGQAVKIFDVTRMHSLGLRCETPLHEGLKRTIQWFTTNYATRGDGIRL